MHTSGLQIPKEQSIQDKIKMNKNEARQAHETYMALQKQRNID